jgi:hypothetical protein
VKSRFRLLYALASILWLAYYAFSFVTIPLAEGNPHFVQSFFYCLLVIVVAPVAMGYFLLFIAAPWINRRLNPAQ